MLPTGPDSPGLKMMECHDQIETLQHSIDSTQDSERVSSLTQNGCHVVSGGGAYLGRSGTLREGDARLKRSCAEVALELKLGGSEAALTKTQQKSI